MKIGCWLFCFTIMKSNSERNNEIEFYRVLIHCSGPGEPWKIEGTHAILPGLGIDNKVIIYYGKSWYRDSRVIIRNFSGEVLPIYWCISDKYDSFYRNNISRWFSNVVPSTKRNISNSNKNNWNLRKSRDCYQGIKIDLSKN